jgi:hypothetical protein
MTSSISWVIFTCLDYSKNNKMNEWMNEWMNGGGMFLWNVSWLSLDYTAFYLHNRCCEDLKYDISWHLSGETEENQKIITKYSKLN